MVRVHKIRDIDPGIPNILDRDIPQIHAPACLPLEGRIRSPADALRRKAKLKSVRIREIRAAVDLKRVLSPPSHGDQRILEKAGGRIQIDRSHIPQVR